VPRANLYPALVEKFCRGCGKRAEIVVISRNQGRNYYFCCDACRGASGTKGPKKSELAKYRPDAPVLQANVELPQDFLHPVTRKKCDEETIVEIAEEVALGLDESPRSDREAIYWAALRKSYGLKEVTACN